MRCLSCGALKQSDLPFGEGNLGPVLTPSLGGPVPLCLPCWATQSARAYGLAFWEATMQSLLARPPKP